MALKRSAWVAILATGALSCRDLGPDRRIIPGFIIVSSVTAVITAPDTVDRGRSFTVRVETLGGECILSAAGTDFALRGRAAEIRPHDVVATGDVTCPSDLLLLPHEVAVRLDSSGTGNLRIIGQRGQGRLGEGGVLDTIERRIVVR